MISKDNSLESVATFMIYVQWFVNMALIAGIPFKGAIAHGLFTSDIENSLYFGQPLIDAFHLQNDFELYGVIMHHTAEQYLIETKYMDNIKNLFNIYKVPMKHGQVNHYIINPYLSSPFSDDVYKSLMIEYYKKVSGIPRQYVDNTYDFLKSFNKKG